MRSIEQWRKEFDGLTPTECFKCILDNLGGYGIEYGFDRDDDADDLANAFEAMQPQRFP